MKQKPKQANKSTNPAEPKTTEPKTTTDPHGCTHQQDYIPMHQVTNKKEPQGTGSKTLQSTWVDTAQDDSSPTLEWADTDSHIDDPELMVDQKTLKQASTMEIMRLQTQNPDLMLTHLVWQKGYPNRYGARIPLKNRWNLDRLEELLVDYQDKEIIEWLRYGWPTGRLPTLEDPVATFKNHKGATDYPEALKQYIQKELKKDAVMGPFSIIPFNKRVGISPIST